MISNPSAPSEAPYRAEMTRLEPVSLVVVGVGLVLMALLVCGGWRLMQWANWKLYYEPRVEAKILDRMNSDRLTPDLYWPLRSSESSSSGFEAGEEQSVNSEQ